eukprot:1151438-Pelagomonas_calceolata.AAC.1
MGNEKTALKEGGKKVSVADAAWWHAGRHGCQGKSPWTVARGRLPMDGATNWLFDGNGPCVGCSCSYCLSAQAGSAHTLCSVCMRL